jgi:hypothetical protein
MTAALAILFFSAVGIIALYLRHVPTISTMTPEEIAGVFHLRKPILTGIWESLLRMVHLIWDKYLRKKIFLFLVKKVSRTRIFIMRLEQVLFHFTRRIRNTSKGPQPSEYWRNIHGWRKTTHWSKKKEE